MRLAGLLRLTAIGIAMLCWVDPPVTVVPEPPVIVDVAVIGSPRDGRPVGNGQTATIAEARADTVRSLADELGRAGTLRVHEVTAGVPIPCDANQPCAIVTDGAAVHLAPDRKGPISIVRVGDALSPNVEAAALSTPAAHLAGQATARISLSGAGVAGRSSRVRLFDGNALVGEGRHQWTADGTAAVDIPWWPIAPGTRTLVARTVTEGVDERTSLDDEVASRVLVEEARWAVVAVERRASWAATFVRRAIESDARFAVSTLTDLAPRVSVATPAAASLDNLGDVRVVVVGAPDALSARDVDHLEAFVRQRGGAVALLPDRPITGPAARLVQHRWQERVEAAPSNAGPLRASEWLLVPEVGPLDLVWAQSGAGPAVVATPVGAGMVLVSGALDAWRHRASDGAFDDFWRATIARLAAAVGPPLAIQVSDPAISGDETVRVEARTTRSVPAWQVSAARACGDAPPTAVRLWPADGEGSFRGRVPAGSRADCRVDARVDGVGEGSARLGAVSASAWSPRWTQEEMAAIAANSGGSLIADGDVSVLVRGWLETHSAERRPEPRYPMRSWWWLLPFVASLAGEWWLRRRTGLR